MNPEIVATLLVLSAIVLSYIGGRYVANLEVEKRILEIENEKLSARVKVLEEADRERRSYTREEMILNGIAALNSIEWEADEVKAKVENAKAHFGKAINGNRK